MGKVIGIDLGTTFSVISYIDESGNPQIIANSEGDRTTPSAVLFDEGEIVVGIEAKNNSLVDPLNYESFVKRHMGESTYRFKNENGDSYTPEEISAIILKKLKRDAEDFLGEEIEGAVITVPAYFNDAQRKSTKDAAQIAGINTMAIINEPTAAALSYGIAKGENNSKILVYDLGGGTFDVTIIKIKGKDIDVLCSRGNRALGGYDFDKEIYKIVKSELKEKGFELESDKNAVQDLNLKCEEAKKTLSNKNKANISLYVNGKPVKVSITREDFEDAIEPMIYQSISVMEMALEEIELEYSDIDKILLVGGSTRIPLIKEMIQDSSEITPSSEVNPDEAVAIGAAYYAVYLKENGISSSDQNTEEVSNEIVPEEEQIVQYKTHDVTSHSVGVLARDEHEVLKNSIILRKNSRVPAKTMKYYTLDAYSTGFNLDVTQGEVEDADYVSIIGNASFAVKPKDTITDIGIEISCDKDSIIHVNVYDISENKYLGEMDIDRISNLTHEEIEESTKKINFLDINS